MKSGKEKNMNWAIFDDKKAIYNDSKYQTAGTVGV